MSERTIEKIQLQTKLWGRVYRLLFMIYSTVLFWELFLGRYRSHGGVRRYNLIPLKTMTLYIENYKRFGASIILINLAGNVLAFMPLGFLLPLVYKQADRLMVITGITLLTSISAEVCQLIFNVGGLDIDDVLLNTLGGVLGYLCYRFSARCLKEVKTWQRR